MHALPLALATLIAVALAPALLRAMAAGGQVQGNYRGRRLPFPVGVLIRQTAVPDFSSAPNFSHTKR